MPRCRVDVTWNLEQDRCRLWLGLRGHAILFAYLLASCSLLQEMKRQDPDFPDVSSGVFVYEVIQGTAAER